MSGARSWTDVPTIVPFLELAAGAMVGEYRVERTIGKGGMGTVYQAVHAVIEKRVALKVVHPALCGNPEAITRFIQEARAVNRIGHPNIVDVFGFGTTADGVTFLAMELLTGESLADRILRLPDAPAPLPVDEACHILVEITHALGAAHDAKIVHRDLKPDNVFLVPSRTGFPHVKLLDFGIAKLSGLDQLDEGVRSPTLPGMVIGTPRYIAPEQARGQRLDGRADIYALGVLAFELLTGDPPFLGDPSLELLAKHVTMRPPRPTDINPKLPPVANEIIGQMLEKDPQNRPNLARIRELIGKIPGTAPSQSVLDLAARRLDKTADVTVSAAAAREAVVAPISETDEQDVYVPRRHSRWWVIPIGLAVVALGVKFAVAIADRSDDDRPIARARDSITPARVEPPIVPGTQHEVVDSKPARNEEHAPIEVKPAIAKPAIAKPVIAKPAIAKPAIAKPQTKPVQTRPRPVETKRIESTRIVKPSIAKPVETKPAEHKPVEAKAEPNVEPKPEPKIEPKRPQPENDDALRDPFAPKPKPEPKR